MPVQRDPLVDVVLRAAFAVHSALGPGLFESVYRDCLFQDLERERLSVRREVTLPVIYKGIRSERAFRLDMVVEGKLVLEIKAVECLLPIHSAQIITYLKLSGLRRGLLMNFNAPRLKDGIKSFLN